MNTLQTGLDRWLTEYVPRLKCPDRIRAHAEAVKPHINGHSFAEVPSVVSAIIRSSIALAPATVNARLHIVRRVCNLAYKQWDWIDKPVGQKVSLLSVNNERHYYLTRAQVEGLARACYYREAGQLLIFAAFTGLRISEMFRFNAHPQLWENCVRLTARTKNGRPRSIPLHPRALNIAKQMPLAITRQQLRSNWEWARKQRHLEHIHWHDLRHTFASWILQARGTIAELKELLGHTTIQQTMRYAHLAPQHLRRAVNRI